MELFWIIVGGALLCGGVVLSGIRKIKNNKGKSKLNYFKCYKAVSLYD